MRFVTYNETPQTTRQRPNKISPIIRGKAPTPHLEPSCDDHPTQHNKTPDTHVVTYTVVSYKTSGATGVVA